MVSKLANRRLAGHIPVYVYQPAPISFSACPDCGRAGIVLPRDRLLRRTPPPVDLRSSFVVDRGLLLSYYHEDRAGRRASAIQFHGHLENGSPPGFLSFFSPLDELLYIALQSFKAHYAIMQHERRQAHALPPRPPPPRTAPILAAMIRLRRRNYPVDEKIRAILNAERAARKLIEDGPTAAERELAAKLVDHAFMIEHLEQFLQDPRWSDDDRIPPPPPPQTFHGDFQPDTAPRPSNVNPEAVKRPHPAESTSQGDRARKRQKTSKSKPARKAPIPAQPPTHTMRTRSNTRRDRTALGALTR